MTKEVVFTPNAVPPLATFSQAIISKGFVYVSGNIGCTSEFMIVEGGVRGQTIAALENLSKILEAAGSGLQHVVKTNVYLTNLARDFSDMNSVYLMFFEENAMPARTCVGIECVAEIPDA
ncbi:Endoribonuclease L-PSP [Suillus lakei]|nr:Endoribonuclease L-PSP [Suillus lakei]